MGSTLMQMMQPQQALMQQGGGMPQQQPQMPMQPPMPPPQMPSSMPPGGGMMMPGPPPQGGGNMPQMGGGKGDVNPLMMLFPGIRRHQEQQQTQQWQMGMQEREMRNAEAVNAYNMRKNEALSREESGGREAIGNTLSYLSDHPANNMQEALKAIKAANPGIDPKLLGPAFAAVAPTFSKEEQNTIKEKQLAEKTEVDKTLEESRAAKTGYETAKLGLDKEEHERKVASDEQKKKHQDALERQGEAKIGQGDDKIKIETQKVMDARAKGDQVEADKHIQIIMKGLDSDDKEVQTWATSQTIDDADQQKAFQNRIMQGRALRRQLLEPLLNPQTSAPSPPAGAPVQGQGGSPQAQPTPPAPSGGEPQTINSPEDAAKLPPGTKYKTPDGDIYTR